MLELRSVDFSYPRRSVSIRSVTASFRAGEMVSIAGPNGSGKSTLLRLMARVVAPGSGEILWKGKRLEDVDPREYARSVGYLPQDFDSGFPMRAIDAVLSARAPFLRRFQWETADDHGRAEEALREFDALELADRYLDEMSGGERKRVFLARVLSGSPELILLDEPFAALDLSHIQQLNEMLRAYVSRTGRTVIFVSHDLNWSGAYADRMLVLSEGSIVADGPPAKVLEPALIERFFRFRSEALERDGRRWIVPR